MNRMLHLPALLDVLDSALEAHLHDQDRRADSATRGGVINPRTGLAEPSHGGTSELLHGLLVGIAIGIRLSIDPAQIRRWCNCAEQAAGFLLRHQRPTGRTDLPSCNFDSGPDVAFTIQALAPMWTWFGDNGGGPDELRETLESIKTFISRAAPGLIGAGFHTPNHRWVMASGMLQAAAMLEDYDPAKEVEAYLAEGFDQDGDGLWQERSIESYDAVVDRSLLLIDRHRGWDGSADAVRRNLQADMLLLDPVDGVAETCLSRRWGGLDVVPLGLATPALMLWQRDRWQCGLELARFLWDRSRSPLLKDTAWLGWALLTGQVVPEGPAPKRLLSDRSALLETNGLWRGLARGATVSLRSRSPDWLAVRFGSARIVRARLRQSYFGSAGDFIADRIEVSSQGGCRLECDGRIDPRRPGYELPLAAPVPGDRWQQSLDQRSQRRCPEIRWEVSARLAEALELHIRTSGGMADVPAMLAMDLPAGAILEAPGLGSCTCPGQTIVLDRGPVRFRWGLDWLQIDGSGGAHRSLEMRDADPPGPWSRLVFAWAHPIDQTVRIRWGRGLDQQDPSDQDRQAGRRRVSR
jgi:hypothetical protein